MRFFVVAYVKRQHVLDTQAQTIQQGLAEKDLEKIAAWWVKGSSIAWNVLYEERSPRRISLPTYPFF